MIGGSRSIRSILGSIAKAASTESTVLITGETGTGKELAAELIHYHSARRTKPLVCINCAAIPDTLLESELFGYERGAFTGAHAAFEGKLQRADGGTVFFDEIGDMTPFAQAKLLRVDRDQRGGSARRNETCEAEHSGHRGHESRSRAAPGARQVSKGPLLPAQRRPDPSAAR